MANLLFFLVRRMRYFGKKNLLEKQKNMVGE